MTIEEGYDDLGVEFHWNDDNLDHVERHGVERWESEDVYFDEGRTMDTVSWGVGSSAGRQVQQDHRRAC